MQMMCFPAQSFSKPSFAPVHHAGDPRTPVRISETSALYEPLTMLGLGPFITGSLGWGKGTCLSTTGKVMSLYDYARQQLLCNDSFHFGGTLLQQWAVSTYVRNRHLLFNFHKQMQIAAMIRDGRMAARQAQRRELQAAIRDGAAASAGVPISTYVPGVVWGSNQYYKQSLEDGLAIAESRGFNLFFTFTVGAISFRIDFAFVLSPLTHNDLRQLFANYFPQASAKMDAVSDNLRGIAQSDAFVLVDRAFAATCDNFMRKLRAGDICGRVNAYYKALEWQGRGYPHVHILINAPDLQRTVDCLGNLVSCSIPGDGSELDLLVKSMQVHEPCYDPVTGTYDQTARCWDREKKRCRAGFPFPFTENAYIAEDGGFFPERKPGPPFKWWSNRLRRHLDVDTRWIVPHNKAVLLLTKLHSNLSVITRDNCAVIYLGNYLSKSGMKAKASVALGVDHGGAAGRHGHDARVDFDGIAVEEFQQHVSASSAIAAVFGRRLIESYPAHKKLYAHDVDQDRVIYNIYRPQDGLEVRGNCSP